MRRERRGPWYLITGVFIGVVLGLAYAWLVDPVAYTDTPPNTLRADYKDHYRRLIALAYTANGDLGRARARLALMGEEDQAPLLAAQAERAVAEGRPVSEVQALSLLAQALGVEVSPILPTPTHTSPAAFPSPESPVSPTFTLDVQTVVTVQASPEVSPTPEDGQEQPGATPEVAFSPVPTLTPTLTPNAPFVLREREFVCDQSLGAPLIQIFAEDAAGQPLPGVSVWVLWEAGQERFFTGLKPEISLGYADYTMQPDITYAVRISESGRLVGDLSAAECQPESGVRFPGSWRLLFVQP